MIDKNNVHDVKKVLFAIIKKYVYVDKWHECKKELDALMYIICYKRKDEQK